PCESRTTTRTNTLLTRTLKVAGVSWLETSLTSCSELATVGLAVVSGLAAGAAVCGGGVEGGGFWAKTRGIKTSQQQARMARVDPGDNNERNIPRPSEIHVLKSGLCRRANGAWKDHQQAVERLYAPRNFCVNRVAPRSAQVEPGRRSKSRHLGLRRDEERSGRRRRSTRGSKFRRGNTSGPRRPQPPGCARPSVIVGGARRL